MSETVRYKGKIKLIERKTNETLEEQCERILREHNYDELKDFYDSWEEMFGEEMYEKYVIHNDKIYEVLEQNCKDTDYDIFEAHKNEDGTIGYEVMYYNGGCSFDEAIGYALDELRKEDYDNEC